MANKGCYLATLDCYVQVTSAVHTCRLLLGMYRISVSGSGSRKNVERHRKLQPDILLTYVLVKAVNRRGTVLAERKQR